MLMENCEYVFVHSPIPMAHRTKARVCGYLFPVIVGSNIAGGMDVYVLWVLSVVR
jgi:hypothetical protein